MLGPAPARFAPPPDRPVTFARRAALALFAAAAFPASPAAADVFTAA